MRTASIHLLGQRFGQRFGLMMLALAFAPGGALAQDLDAAYASASPLSNPTDELLSGDPLTPDEAIALRNALDFNSNMSSAAPAKPLRLRGLPNSKGADFNRTDRPDGSSAIVMKQQLPIDWDGTIGADLGFRPAPSLGYRPDRPIAGPSDDRGTGAAWASVGMVPKLATLEARVDPSNDQGRLGTTFKHSMPVGSHLSVTLQNSYSITETFASSSPVQSEVPLMAVPAASAPTPQVWGNERAAKFDILPTGTSFGAKLASNSTDPVSHNQLSAHQKIYGPLNVTTAVTDLGQSTTSKSISAGFKLKW